MVFAVCGLVKWKGEKLANGIDGKFETTNEKVITRLQTLGFKEYVEKPLVSESELFKCDICGAGSRTKAGIASHKRFNHKEVIQ